VVAAPFADRGRRCDEYLEVMRRLWCDETSEHHGEFYDLPTCRLYPKPIQAPHPPIHVGGESKAAMRRVARLGQGWYTFNRLPEELAPALVELEEALAAEGRTRADIQLSVCPYMHPLTPEILDGYKELGVDRVTALIFCFDHDTTLQSLDGLLPFLEQARA
jgi:alkanesulfonate monooxygenase SsuD/methylene tetrahydromethanopterin reductase-like flavin-dependent oxidoreductase (luciferase family)